MVPSLFSRTLCQRTRAGSWAETVAAQTAAASAKLRVFMWERERAGGLDEVEEQADPDAHLGRAIPQSPWLLDPIPGVLFAGDRRTRNSHSPRARLEPISRGSTDWPVDHGSDARSGARSQAIHIAVSSRRRIHAEICSGQCQVRETVRSRGTRPRRERVRELGSWMCTSARRSSSRIRHAGPRSSDFDSRNGWSPSSSSMSRGRRARARARLTSFGQPRR